MPRVKPSRSRFVDTDIAVAWTSFAWDDPETGYEYVVRKGERLRASLPVVRANEWRFVKDGTPDDEMPPEFSIAPPPEEPPMFDRPMKVKVKRNVAGLQIGSRRYEPQEVFEASAAQAEMLVCEGSVELGVLAPRRRPLPAARTRSARRQAAAYGACA